MYHIHAGFITNYLADLTNPAWLYIRFRGLSHPSISTFWMRLFRGKPGLLALAIFGAGVITETSQIYWPKGIFRGVYDTMDIVAFAVGLLAVYGLDKYLLVQTDKYPVM